MILRNISASDLNVGDVVLNARLVALQRMILNLVVTAKFDTYTLFNAIRDSDGSVFQLDLQFANNSYVYYISDTEFVSVPTSNGTNTISTDDGKNLVTDDGKVLVY